MGPSLVPGLPKMILDPLGLQHLQQGLFAGHNLGHVRLLGRPPGQLPGAIEIIGQFYAMYPYGMASQSA